VVTLKVPPLRERQEDIPLLAHHFLEEFAARNRKSIRGFTPQAMDLLMKYPWPGNVRELMNAVERAVVLTRSDFITPEDLSLPSLNTERENNVPDALPLEEMEKKTIMRTLAKAGGNKSEAARRLGITRRTLHLKLKKYGLM